MRAIAKGLLTVVVFVLLAPWVALICLFAVGVSLTKGKRRSDK